MHVLQTVLVFWSAYEPLAHAWHALELPSEYMPKPHTLQNVAPLNEYVPPEQPTQLPPS
jgi:hypothetical protein